MTADKKPKSTHHQLAGRKGAHASWANTVDRTARTQHASSKSPSHIDWHLDRLGPAFDNASSDQRHAAAESARKAYMTELQIRSAAARRNRGSAA